MFVLKAGSRVSVKGHVSTLGGTLAADFRGLMYATVSDNVELITCRNNAGTASTPFTYNARSKTLYIGGTFEAPGIQNPNILSR